MIRLLSIASLIFIASPLAHALSIRINFDTLVASSPVVALVEIEKGEIVRNTDGEHCGARYVGRVISSIKGAKENDQLDFGFYIGRGIGTKFIVFLVASPDLPPPTSRQPPITMSSVPPYLARCSKHLPPYMEVDEGMGTIPVVSGDAVGYKPAVELDSSHYVIPAKLVGTHKYTGRILNDLLFGSVQIEAETFIGYLRTLATAAR